MVTIDTFKSKIEKCTESEKEEKKHVRSANWADPLLSQFETVLPKTSCNDNDDLVTY